MTTIRDVTNRIEKFEPKHLAEDWDPIGLSFGSYDKEIKKVMVALDLDQNTLREAKEKNATCQCSTESRNYFVVCERQRVCEEEGRTGKGCRKGQYDDRK